MIPTQKKNLKHDQEDISGSTGEQNEKEANIFAAELLMNADEFEKKWHEYEGNLSRLSEYFGVSVTSIEYRAEKLGLYDTYYQV